ncbi:hypothetical protein DFO73_106185 [Cytobacillus oceanisediminis]|uniref:Uncharacterized protein n=1 Tax=Cytobacillus oceanisediminis TaxID=665099 RepID=A0A2V2ZY81_9BACI|nr:hypothetical protein [Cytobacillus oceanisediminis]PWW28369.1 hypothetical protein DFO73_106185 [Cytobacillus oceanisediminis]
MSDKDTINDGMDHLNKIEGYPTDVELKKLPRPFKIFWILLYKLLCCIDPVYHHYELFGLTEREDEYE